MAESENNELDEGPRPPPLNVEHPKELYRGGLEIIADVVRRADDPNDPAERVAAWMTIKSALHEVERHTEPEEPPSQ